MLQGAEGKEIGWQLLWVNVRRIYGACRTGVGGIEMRGSTMTEKMYANAEIAGQLGINRSNFCMWS